MIEKRHLKLRCTGVVFDIAFYPSTETAKIIAKGVAGGEYFICTYDELADLRKCIDCVLGERDVEKEDQST